MCCRGCTAAKGRSFMSPQKRYVNNKMVDRSETYSCSTATTNETTDERLLEMNDEQLENFVKDLE